MTLGVKCHKSLGESVWIFGKKLFFYIYTWNVKIDLICSVKILTITKWLHKLKLKIYLHSDVIGNINHSLYIARESPSNSNI